MFGMGGSEIIVILIVALLFLGPDKLPQAAKSISKGIRDIKKQSRALQQQIESDEQIGGAIRDLKSALRGDEAPVKPKPFKPRIKKELTDGSAGAAALVGATAGLGDPATADTAAVATVTDDAATGGAAIGHDAAATGDTAAHGTVEHGTASGDLAASDTAAEHLNGASTASDDLLERPLIDEPLGKPLTLPPTAGQPDAVDSPGGDDDLAALVKPAIGSIAKGS